MKASDHLRRALQPWHGSIAFRKSVVANLVTIGLLDRRGEDKVFGKPVLSVELPLQPLEGRSSMILQEASPGRVVLVSPHVLQNWDQSR